MQVELWGYDTLGLALYTFGTFYNVGICQFLIFVEDSSASSVRTD